MFLGYFTEELGAATRYVLKLASTFVVLTNECHGDWIIVAQKRIPKRVFKVSPGPICIVAMRASFALRRRPNCSMVSK
jgi:hypothetical protein